MQFEEKVCILVNARIAKLFRNLSALPQVLVLKEETQTGSKLMLVPSSLLRLSS